MKKRHRRSIGASARKCSVYFGSSYELAMNLNGEYLCDAQPAVDCSHTYNKYNNVINVIKLVTACACLQRRELYPSHW